MARCDKFPFCGHEPGCCPRFDLEQRQLDAACILCKDRLPVVGGTILCDACLERNEPEYQGTYDA